MTDRAITAASRRGWLAGTAIKTSPDIQWLIRLHAEALIRERRNKARFMLGGWTWFDLQGRELDPITYLPLRHILDRPYSNPPMRITLVNPNGDTP
jgi:hypothetical protein